MWLRLLLLMLLLLLLMLMLKSLLQLACAATAWFALSRFVALCLRPSPAPWALKVLSPSRCLPISSFVPAAGR